MRLNCPPEYLAVRGDRTGELSRHFASEGSYGMIDQMGLTVRGMNGRRVRYRAFNAVPRLSGTRPATF